MAERPVMLLTHLRACSTAFERVFLHREDIICVHEPFDNAFFWGPERLHNRHENDENARRGSGGSEVTYKTAFDIIQNARQEGKHLFVKGMARVLMPLNGNPPSIAPSLLPPDLQIPSAGQTTSETSPNYRPPYPYIPHITEPGNPTVLPNAILRGFHFTFLIRHPRLSIPSVYRLSTPPQCHITGWHGFRPEDTGYAELRRLFNYLLATHQIGPAAASQNLPATDPEPAERHQDKDIHTDANPRSVQICLIDADDLLDDPVRTMAAYCSSAGLPFHPSMLEWNGDANRKQKAEAQFGNWMRPFHEVAIVSGGIRRKERKGNGEVSMEEDYAKWTEEFGREGADVVRRSVEENVEHYEYLRRFRLRSD